MWSEIGSYCGYQKFCGQKREVTVVKIAMWQKDGAFRNQDIINAGSKISVVRNEK